MPLLQTFCTHTRETGKTLSEAVRKLEIPKTPIPLVQRRGTRAHPTKKTRKKTRRHGSMPKNTECTEYYGHRENSSAPSSDDSSNPAKVNSTAAVWVKEQANSYT